MAALAWDVMADRVFETGIDHGVLYIPDLTGAYNTGFAWNGLVSITEAPSGAEASPQYADNIKYLNLVGVEEFGGTIEAFTYPDEFMQCDGTAEPEPGVFLGQQARKLFGLCYRTKVGTALDPEAGYKLHLVYGCLAAPSEKGYTTVNDSPEPLTFSWEFTTSPVGVTGFKPTSIVTVDSRTVSAPKMASLETLLYGGASTEPELPMPDDVLALITAP